MRGFAALLIWLLVQAGAVAAAQAPSGTASAAFAAPLSVTASAACADDLTAALKAGGTVALHILRADGSPSDGEMVWQPPNGTIAFTLPKETFAGQDAQDTLVVCFRLKGQPFRVSPQVSLDSVNAATSERTYSARLPANLAASVPGVTPPKFLGAPRTAIIARNGTMRVLLLGADGTARLAMDRQIGITSAWVAAGIALLAAGLALVFAWRVAAAFNVPGKWFLKIVSTKRGYASLSQFQVVLWTFVVGAGSIYVMALSGNLITISNGTLVLLGIAGAATATSKLQSAQSDAATTASPAAGATSRKPDKIASVSVVGVTDTEVTLAWSPATTGGRPRSYLLEYRPTTTGASNTWLAVAETITATRYRVLNLAQNQAYEFRVTPINEYDRGDPSDPVTQKTKPSDAQESAPDKVAGLRQTGMPAVGVFALAWSDVAQAKDYVVQYRRHNSDEDWRQIWKDNATSTSIQLPIADLTADFRVAAATAADVVGKWSDVLTASALRRPCWADLVITYNGTNEVDVTRVQMLFFTAVTALFVGLNIVSSYAIPEIPEGYLLLMGISNGVYLTAKFVPG